MRASCPICERFTESVFLTREEVAAELHARDRFFARRLGRWFRRDQLRDVTHVVLGTPATIFRCPRCGVLMRDPAPGEDFRNDRYDDDVLKRLHDTHARAFRAKEIDYRSVLRLSARVAEVGSYVGGFLRTAAEWNWNAVGVDIGRDVVRFCRRLGLDARCLELRDCALDSQSCEAVFVWNCFEQVADPHELLAEAHRVLSASGLLTIRIPDAAFYVRRRSDASALALLAYNGVLGWPHRFGYDATALRHLAEKHGFALVRTLRRPAIRPLRDAMHSWACEEETAILAAGAHGWIESTFERR